MPFKVQSSPPYWGSGLSQRRVLVLFPPPHVTGQYASQGPHEPQSPSTITMEPFELIYKHIYIYIYKTRMIYCIFMSHFFIIVLTWAWDNSTWLGKCFQNCLVFTFNSKRTTGKHGTICSPILRYWIVTRPGSCLIALSAGCRAIAIRCPSSPSTINYQKYFIMKTDLLHSLFLTKSYN